MRLVFNVLRWTKLPGNMVAVVLDPNWTEEGYIMMTFDQFESLQLKTKVETKSQLKAGDPTALDQLLESGAYVEDARKLGEFPIKPKGQASDKTSSEEIEYDPDIRAQIERSKELRKVVRSGNDAGRDAHDLTPAEVEDIVSLLQSKPPPQGEQREYLEFIQTKAFTRLSNMTRANLEKHKRIIPLKIRQRIAAFRNERERPAEANGMDATPPVWASYADEEVVASEAFGYTAQQEAFRVTQPELEQAEVRYAQEQEQKIYNDQGLMSLIGRVASTVSGKN